MGGLGRGGARPHREGRLEGGPDPDSKRKDPAAASRRATRLRWQPSWTTPYRRSEETFDRSPLKNPAELARDGRVLQPLPAPTRGPGIPKGASSGALLGEFSTVFQGNLELLGAIWNLLVVTIELGTFGFASFPRI